MGASKQIHILLLTLLCWSCNDNSKYPFAISDFRKTLQPHLTLLVSKGIVDSDTTLNIATDKELVQLGKSEHPILRAKAFREMQERSSFDHFAILMDHLDDTAIVAIDVGEWGVWPATVSDDILNHATWKSREEKNKTIEKVITKHNYLRSAYTILDRIEPNTKYYFFIKDMALRKRTSIPYYLQPYIKDTEFAIYALAKYKKKGDVEVIKEMLLANNSRLSDLSYKLMGEYPDPAYLEVFEAFYPKGYYRAICRDRDPDKAVNFINSLAVYKNATSAQILDSILNKGPFVNCAADTNYIKHELMYAIWNNPCAAYTKLRKQVEEKVKYYESLPTIELPAMPVTKEIIRW